MKPYKIYVVFVLLFLSVPAFCQQWGKPLAVSQYGMDIFSSYDSGIVITSYDNHDNKSWGFIKKLKDDGSYAWQKNILTGNGNSISSFCDVSGGFGVLIGGCGQDTNTCGIVVAKLDYCYNEIWSRIIDTKGTEGAGGTKIYPLSDGSLLVNLGFSIPLLQGLMLFDASGNVKWATPFGIHISPAENSLVIDEKNNEIAVAGFKYLPSDADSSVYGIRSVFLTLSLSTGKITSYYTLNRAGDYISAADGIYKQNDTFYYLALTDYTYAKKPVVRLLKTDKRGVVQGNTIISDTSVAGFAAGLLNGVNGSMTLATLSSTTRNSKDPKIKLYALDENQQLVKEKTYGNADTIFEGLIKMINGPSGSYYIFSNYRTTSNPTVYYYLMKVDENLEWMNFSTNPNKKYDYKCPTAINNDTVWINPQQVFLTIDSNNLPKPIDFFLSIENTNFMENNWVEIYPNPSGGIFTININTVAQLSVFNSAGSLVLDKEVTANTEIDLSRLSKGVYYIHVISQNKVTTKKLILH